MVEIRKLNKGDYDELFEVLTKTFENKNKRPVYFDKAQPKMWVRDDEHMSKHTGAFEDGRLVSVVGVYPLPLVIDGEKFMLYTTGNVATLPSYEGKGYFTKLFNMAMQEIEELHADGARLGGARQRYGRFGFEGGGSLYKFAVAVENVRATKPDMEDISLVKIERENVEALRLCYEMMKKKEVCVDRSVEDNYRDMYLGLITKFNAPYLVKRKEELVGYLCINEKMNEISEFYTNTARDLYDAVCYLQANYGNREVCITIPPYLTEELRLFANKADRAELITPSRFKFLNYEGIAGALLRLKAKKTKLSAFDYKIHIEDYGTIRLYNNENGAGCEKVDCDGDISLTSSETIRLLYSYTPTELIADLPCELKSALPLPLSWATLDYV
ncbi:MAG: GNAT family N-acetyltransferase [Clostridia bacterium]|nr:GNAT family N-acetyltransferase [Clostridia bacterium]